MACLKTFAVNISIPGTGHRVELLEAVNPIDARRQAEARFPHARVGGINQKY